MIEAVSNPIADNFSIGNTKVSIATDYCFNKTQRDVDDILCRIGTNALQSFIAASR